MGANAFQWLTNPRVAFENWEPTSEWKDTAFARRRMFFERHASHRNGFVVCPACGYPTLAYRNGYDCCSICHWEDEGQDDPWGDQYSGPNDHTLNQSRRNFAQSYSVWSFDEVGDFSPGNQYRLFSDEAQKELKKLCALYDGLLELTAAAQIQRQWQLIDKQWKTVP